jgi:hypothetical protein
LADRAHRYTAVWGTLGYDMETLFQPTEGRRPKSSAALFQAKVLRVHGLVHEGDYDTALELLVEMEPTPAVLDLRARIEAQRGQYADAHVLWTRVLDEAPNHTGARKGLCDVQRAATRRKILHHVKRGAGLLALVAGGVLVGLSLAPGKAAKASASATVQQPKAATSAAAVPITSPAIIAPADVPALALPEGVSVSTEGRARIYSFEGGLFSQGVQFAPGARERVTALGRALAPHRDAIQVELIGYVDTLPESEEARIHENTALALSRASAALGRLARTTRIPAEDFLLRAVGQRLGPFSEERSDPRNRTVQIRVSPR